MQHKPAVAFVVAGLLLCAGCNSIQAQKTATQGKGPAFVGQAVTADVPDLDRSLRGVKAVRLRVQRLSEEAMQRGLSTRDLLARATTELQNAGIQVVGDEQFSAPLMFYEIDTLKIPTSADLDLFSVRATLELYERAYLARESDPKTPHEVRTIALYGFGTMHGRELAEGVRGDLRENMQGFITKWKNANK